MKLGTDEPGFAGLKTLRLPADIEHVIFDCDGVLVDSEILCCGALRDNLLAIGIRLSLQEIVDLFLGRDFRAVDEYSLAVVGRGLPTSFRSRLAARIMEGFVDLKPIDGAVDAVARLKVPASVASSSDRARVIAALTLTGLLSPFGGRVWTAGDVLRAKPAPDLFLHAATACAVSPSRALVIEDSLHGIRAAKAAGMQVWGFTGGSHYRFISPDLREAGADLVFDDMNLLWPAP